MKRLLVVLAQAMICTSLLALPVKAMGEEMDSQPPERQMPAEMDPQFEEQLAKELESLPNFDTSSDMKQALHELPEVGDE